HRGHLQDLRRVVQGRGAPLPGAGRRESSRGRGPRRLTAAPPPVAGPRFTGSGDRLRLLGAPLAVPAGRWSNRGQARVNVGSNTWPWRLAQGACATVSAGGVWVESKGYVEARDQSEAPE